MPTRPGTEGGSVFCCPECVGSLDHVEGGYQCRDCSETYPILDGVPVFSRSREAYYGEIPRAEMQEILARARTASWQTALLEHADRTDSLNFSRYATDNIRSAFEFLLNTPIGNVLDFGCGPGAISIALARHATGMYATDLTYERVAFAQIRAVQEGLTNFHAFCSGDRKHIPVCDGFFDTIVLDGVLEWLPAFSAGEPTDIQISFLKEIGRVLKPDGLLFVAIENRIALSYFRGVREHHTRLRYISLMPRMVANWYSRVAAGKPLRPYTYTKSQYKRLFRKAGFNSVEFWGLLPDYRNIQTAFDLSRSTMVRNALPTPASRLKRVRNAVATPMLPWLSDCFGIRVQYKPDASRPPALDRNGDGKPFVYDLLRHISETYLDREVLTPIRYCTSAHYVHVVAQGVKKYIVHLPLSLADEKRLDKGLKAATEIARVAPIPIAPLVAQSSYKGIEFAINLFTEGSPVHDISSSRPAICDLLVSLYRHTQGPIAPWKDILQTAAERYAADLQRAANTRLAQQIVGPDRLNHLINYVCDISGSGSSCAIHGDFWTDNILEQKGRITSVLDWDRFDPVGLPYLDLSHLLTKQERDRSVDCGLGQAVIRVHESRLASELVKLYTEKLSLPADLASRCIVVYWLRQVSILLTEDKPVTAHQLRACIEQPLDYFTRIADRSR